MTPLIQFIKGIIKGKYDKWKITIYFKLVENTYNIKEKNKNNKNKIKIK